MGLCRRFIGVATVTLASGLLGPGMATATEMAVPPQTGPAAQADFSSYLAAMPGKAFVVGPGGAWAWQSGQLSGEAALGLALAACNAQAQIKCVPYAVDDRRVFDEGAWAKAWGPYLSRRDAADRPVGLMRGARFPDIEFVDAKGKQRALAQFRGRAVVLHFWGSWCAPCRHELPDMARFAKAMAGHEIAFLPLQVRESYADSQRWLAREQIALTVFDSGMRSADDGEFRVRGGGRLPDRAVAPVFPSTVFLDRHGVIVFVHHGPIARWEDYRPQLLNLLAGQRKR